MSRASLPDLVARHFWPHFTDSTSLMVSWSRAVLSLLILAQNFGSVLRRVVTETRLKKR